MSPGSTPAPTTTSRNRTSWTNCWPGCGRSFVAPGSTHPTTPTTRELSVGDLRLDPRARRAFRGSREIELSKTEFDLLELLVDNAGIVLDHSTIYERIWQYDFGPDSKNLAVYIGYLRRKTEADGEPRLIHTVRGVGYTARVGS